MSVVGARSAKLEQRIDLAKSARWNGRLDEAVRRLTDLGEPADASVDTLYIQWLAELERHEELQAALRRSIERLDPGRAGEDSDYLKLLFGHAELSCLEPERIDALLAKTEAAAREDTALSTWRRAVQQRQEVKAANRAGLEGHATLVSIGLNCMPWSLPNRWGLRSPEEFISLFTPFSYGVHKMKGLLRAVRSDFEEYCRPDQLTTVETEGGHLMPMHTDHTAMWNHNLGLYWTKNEFAKLRANMAHKAENFRRACRKEDVVFLLGKSAISYPQEPIGFLEKLNAGLERLTGRPNNRVILSSEFADAQARWKVDEWTTVLDCPYPSASYVWYDDEAGTSDEGLAYEQGLAGAILDCLRDWGLLTSRTPAAG